MNERLLSAAQGKIPCDLIIRNAQVFDVFTCTFKPRDLAVKDGVIVGCEEKLNLKAARTINAQHKSLVPGFIDAHVHIESSLLTPRNFQSVVIHKGTTTAICDPHELANVMGLPGIEYFLDQAAISQLNLQVMLSSCVPATHFETNGGGTLSASDLARVSSHPNALGLAEVMNVPGILNGDEALLEKIQNFTGRPIDGHAPCVTGLALSAYAAMGINSCHESSKLAEASEKLEKGISIWIREGSVAKDLDALVPLLTLATSTSIGFCTDDRNPLDIALEGHLDHLIRTAIHKGVAPEVAYRASSWSVARHYGLDRAHPGRARIGALSPGYRADFVILGDVDSCAVDQVFIAGVNVQEIETKQPSSRTNPNLLQTIQATAPNAADLEGPQGLVNVIGVQAGSLITDHHVMKSNQLGVCKFSVLNRYQKQAPPSNAYVHGFGELFTGAIASSVGHDSHNLAVVGSNTRDMKVALQAIIESQGGFAVVKDGTVLAHLALPFGGLMSEAAPQVVAAALTRLREASHQIGCVLPEPFLQLAFLCLPVIPKLKLTDQGLVDVNAFCFISVSA